MTTLFIPHCGRTAAIALLCCTQWVAGGWSCSGPEEEPDLRPVLSVLDAQRLEGDRGRYPMVFPVRVSAPVSEPVELSYATRDGDAVGDEDFVARRGSLTLPSGATDAYIAIDLLGDDVREGDESFTLILTAASASVRIDSTSARGTIEDDDTPILLIPMATVIEGELAAIDVWLSEPSEETVTLSYATRDDTAVADVDYQMSSGELVIEPGETGGELIIATVEDAFVEGSEYVILDLDVTGDAIAPLNEASLLIIDDEEPPAISDVFVGGFTSTEGNGADTVFRFPVSVFPRNPEPITVDFETAPGEATNPDDFEAREGSVVIPPFASSVEIDVVVRGDLVFEEDETFSITLTAVSGPALLGNDTGVGLILNDDVPVSTGPTVSVHEARFDEAAAEAQTMRFAVTLSSTTTHAVDVSYETNALTADDSDFVPATGTVSIPAGARDSEIEVVILGDDIQEPPEAFEVELTGVSSGVRLATASAKGHIFDDDAPLAVRISDASVLESDDGAELLFDLTLSAASSQPVTVDYRTENRGATAGSDYEATTGTVTFDAGELLAQITVRVVGDEELEPDEAFGVLLENPVGASLGWALAYGTILNDDGFGWSEPETLTLGYASEARDPQVHLADDGTAVVLWRQSGSPAQLLSSRYVPGSGWQAPLVLAPAGGSAPEQPRVSGSPGGRIVALWEEDGAFWSGEYSPSLGWFGQSPVGSLAFISDGAIAVNRDHTAVFAAWTEAEPLEKMGAFAARRDLTTGSNPDPFGPAARIDGELDWGALRPQVAVDEAGAATVVWFQSDGIRLRARANRYVPSVGWTGEHIFRPDSFGDGAVPQVGVDAVGRVIVAWQEAVGGDPDIYVSHYVEDDWTEPQLLEFDGPYLGAHDPALAVSPSGHAVVVWRQYNGVSTEVRASHFDPTAGTWSAYQSIQSGSPASLDDARVAIDADGNATALWPQPQYEGAPFTMHASRFDRASGTWSTSVALEPPNPASDDPQIAMNAAGAAIAVWEREGEIIVRRFTPQAP